jgi:hypothetical protein
MAVSMGRLITEDDFWFHPYLAPRLVVDAYLGDDVTHEHGDEGPHRHSHDDLDLGFALDVGADFSVARGWAIRFSASVGDRDGLAIGFSIPS